MWDLADAEVSCQVLGGLSIPLGREPQVSGWGRGRGPVHSVASCSRLLWGCPSGGMGDGF